MRCATCVFALGVLAVCAGVACGARPPPPPAPARPVQIATASAVPVAAPANDPPPAAPDFPASPITAFANQVMDLVGRVLDGNPPPNGPLPLVAWQQRGRR